jgi:hypothetical protein
MMNPLTVFKETGWEPGTLVCCVAEAFQPPLVKLSVVFGERFSPIFCGAQGAARYRQLSGIL